MTQTSQHTPDPDRSLQLIQELHKKHIALITWGCNADGIPLERMLAAQLAGLRDFIQENADKISCARALLLETGVLQETLETINEYNVVSAKAVDGRAIPLDIRADAVSPPKEQTYEQ